MIEPYNNSIELFQSHLHFLHEYPTSLVNDSNKFTETTKELSEIIIWGESNDPSYIQLNSDFTKASCLFDFSIGSI